MNSLNSRLRDEYNYNKNINTKGNTMTTKGNYSQQMERSQDIEEEEGNYSNEEVDRENSNLEMEDL